MPFESKCSHESDECPYCERPFEIAAVNFNFWSRNVILFVCPCCGLAKAETRDNSWRKLRSRILSA